MNHKSKYTRSGIDAATMVVVVSWISIWFLWASVDEPIRSDNQSRMCRISCVAMLGNGLNSYRDPERFHTPALITDIQEDEGMAVGDSDMRIKRSRPVELQALGNSRLKDNHFYQAADTNFMVLGTYRLKWVDENLFKNADSRKPGVINIEVFGSLKKLGFKVPGVSKESFKQINTPWQITLSIDVDSAGNVEHVFLLSGSGDQQLDLEVVRMMYQAQVAVPGGDCAGQVVVSSAGEIID